MNEIFKWCYEGSYSLRYQNSFKIPLVNTVYNGTEVVSFLGSKIWEFIPMKIKELGICKQSKLLANWTKQKIEQKIIQLNKTTIK